MEQAEQNVFLKGVNRTRQAYAYLARRRFTTLAGTLVFFLVMSLMPFAFWLTLLFGRSDFVFGVELFGWAEEFFAFVRESAMGATAGVNVLFLATTLWSSTGFFYHLRRIGEIIYGSDRTKHGWKVRVSAVLLTFCVLLFFAFFGGVLVGVGILAEALPTVFSYLVRYSLIFVFSFFGAWILNGYVCPYKISPADTALGSFFTALAWLVASVVFAVYLNFSNAERLYGALSLVIVFLLWLYWLMTCFAAGVIYNSRRISGQKEHKTL